MPQAEVNRTQLRSLEDVLLVLVRSVYPSPPGPSEQGQEKLYIMTPPPSVVPL